MPNNKKLTKELISSICKLIEEGGHTIAEICSLSGISKRSFYKWQAENAQFTCEISRARENANEIIVVEAKHSLSKLLVDHEEVETKTKTRNMKDGTQRTTIIRQTHHIPADMEAIILVLNSKDNFNRAALDGYLRRKKKCPLSRYNPSKVTPNRRKSTT